MKKLFIAIFLLAGLAAAWVNAQDKGGQEVMKIPPAQKLGYVEKIIETYYVDSVNPDRLVEDAIVAMLKGLDPHSSYTNPEETKELTQPLDGNFSGIGIQFNMLSDTLFVVQTTSGGPSEKVGILPGDRIVQAGDSVIAGRKMPNSRIIKILRGPKGSEVDLKVLRKGVQEPLTFHIVRDDIPIYSVDASYMADPQTGYIRISRFAESTEKEFQKAVAELKAQGMRQLILDLEDNGGGYLGAAHQLASNFLNRGDMVVYTKSPSFGRQDYRAETNGSLRDIPVVVMANQYSASAAEITAGALQDNDRGLVVGRRTFGKGLVQRPFPFPDGSMIRLTTSKYYTPSGRSIQKPYTKGEGDEYRLDMLHRLQSGEFSSADSVHFADSLRFETLRNGRTVYGGGGIMPDVFVPIDTAWYTPYYRDLVAKGIINRYAITYVDDHRKQLRAQYPSEQAFIDGFSTDSTFMKGLIASGEADSVKFNAEQYDRSRQMMQTVLKAIIGRDLFEQSTYFKIVNPQVSPSYRAALDLINDRERYRRLLEGK